LKGNENIRVLIVEDDYLIGETIKRTLKTIGYEVAGKASNGLEAVEMACSLRPDIVLMDIQMPDLDGLEATRRIQECCPVPVVALTAYESQDLVNKAGEVGVAAYLTKPPRRAEIERAVTIAMARHRDMMELRRLYGELETQKNEIEKALAEIKILRGILPICSRCKNIRNDKGYWEEVEAYVGRYSEAAFSHGLCPGCMDKLYGDEDWYKKSQGEK